MNQYDTGLIPMIQGDGKRSSDRILRCKSKRGEDFPLALFTPLNLSELAFVGLVQPHSLVGGQEIKFEDQLKNK